MKALVWHGKEDIRCDIVTDPEIEHPRDAIIKVTSCAICGSDLHLFHNLIPAMLPGDIVGHETMGEVVEVGGGLNGRLRVGERIVVPFTISCGECAQCRRGNFSVCEVTNRKAALSKAAFGHQTAGLFGYTHLTGGYPGGQADYLRVPYADTTHIKIPSTMPDDQALFLSDILPTGWQAAVHCEIEPTDTVAVWGCGPVGQMAIRSAVLLGAAQVIAIDHLPDRLSMARAGGALTIDFEAESVVHRLNDLTDGKGPDKCIDAVGLESHVTPSLPDTLLDRTKQMMMLENDRPHALREIIFVCRPGGIVSIPGVYSGLADKIPLGIAMNKGLTFRTGQTHVQRWADDLVRRIDEGEIDPSFVITHAGDLEDGPDLYRLFRNKQDGCVKVILTP